MSDFVRPQRWQPTRLPHPWDSPGKNTGVGCHFLLQCMRVKSESEVAQSCSTLCDPMDCSLPGSSIHGIFQARVLEWGAIAFFSCVWFFATPWTAAHQAHLSMGYSRQEFWSGLPFPPPGDLPDPGIEPASLMSPALAGGFFTSSATWEALAAALDSNKHSGSSECGGLCIFTWVKSVCVCVWEREREEVGEKLFKNSIFTA